MYLIEANVGKGTKASARSNIHRVRWSLAPARPLANLVEIDEGEAYEHAMVDQEFPGPIYKSIAFSTREPVMVPSGWDIIDPQVTKIHDGIEKVTPRRNVVHAVLQRGDREFADVSTHFLNGRDRNPDLEALWEHSVDVLREVVYGYAERGITVWWSGDTNADGRMPMIHKREERVVSAYNDFIGFVEGRTQVTVRGSGKIHMTIDGHNAHWVNFMLGGKS